MRLGSKCYALPSSSGEDQVCVITDDLVHLSSPFKDVPWQIHRRRRGLSSITPWGQGTTGYRVALPKLHAPMLFPKMTMRKTVE